MWQQIKNIYHLLVALLANIVFGHPSSSMTIIGVTGTDGKTTTSSLIYHILSQSGKKAALISTVGAVINNKTYDTGFHVTTPSSFAIQNYLKKAKDEGVEIVVLEVTSHALDQNRILGIPFSVGVVTNITHEHLDYHKNYEKYVKAKSLLIERAKVGILNKDDESYALLRKFLRGSKEKIITYGEGDANITSSKVGSPPVQLFGDYNKYNYLAAASVCLELGLSAEAIKKSAKSFVLPKGRTEVVYNDDFMVMIDFAHTPNAFKHLLQSLKKQKSNGRLIHVFGSAGLRDKSKRKKMGEIASEYDDIIILTAEDPRTESLEEIINDIAGGIISVGDVPEVHTIPDRQEAITFAIRNAKRSDIVVITGKGHETSMNFFGKEVSWSEYEAVKKALTKRYEK